MKVANVPVKHGPQISEQEWIVEIGKQLVNYKKHLAVLYYHSGYEIDFAVKLLQQFGAEKKQ
jgi:hypothetical protein